MNMGYNCVLHRNTGVDYATPTWAAIAAIVEATCTSTAGEGDVTNRASGGFNMTEPGLIANEITGTIKEDNTDAGFLAIQGAYVARTSLDVWALDGPISLDGAMGWRMVVKVFEFTRTEPGDGAVEYSFKLKPCKSTHVPSWDTNEVP